LEVLLCKLSVSIASRGNYSGKSLTRREGSRRLQCSIDAEGGTRLQTVRTPMKLNPLHLLRITSINPIMMKVLLLLNNMAWFSEKKTLGKVLGSRQTSSDTKILLVKLNKGQLLKEALRAPSKNFQIAR
jgi:hypothetical protein